MQNEYGLSSWKAIVGIEILNEGGGLSVDDITNEEQTTYVARAATAWVPWTPGAPSGDTGNFFGGAGGNTAGESTIRPFVGGEDSTILKQYEKWLGVNEPTT